MNLLSLGRTLLGLAAASSALHAQSPLTPLTEVRSSLEKWVETRQLISKTKSDWISDKEMLEQSVALLERELRGVEESISKVSTNNTHAASERSLTEAQLTTSQESLARSKAFTEHFEPRILALLPRLPSPLQDILKPLVARIPTSASTKMPPTERVQVVIGILNELDKFNNAVTLFSEKQRNSKGDEIAVETVYVGLGAAYFVNDSGDFAGLGVPGPKGWEWTVKPECGPRVRDVIRIYRNEQTARFISLPVSIR